jgi:hypothetical protein
LLFPKWPDCCKDFQPMNTNAVCSTSQPATKDHQAKTQITSSLSAVLKQRERKTQRSSVSPDEPWNITTLTSTTDISRSTIQQAA